jgi:hypothetical protein
MNIASKIMIGRGIPINQSKAPFPKPIVASIRMIDALATRPVSVGSTPF